MKLVLYGSGGHGKVVADIVRAAGIHELLGFIDDDPGAPRILGTFPDALNPLNPLDTCVIVCIGSNELRSAKAAWVRRRGFLIGTAVHPDAVLAPDVEVGAGTVVMAGVVVNATTRIGENVILNTGATIDHDCDLGDAVHVAPGVNLCGGVRVGRETLVGVGSAVIPNIRIGERCVVGAGSVVVRDVPDGATVVGNPARERR